METVTVLLMLVAMATAYPYSPYTDHKGEPKNVQLSEEAVAAYLKSKMEDEDLEPAKIMDYVETLLQGGKKGGPPTDGPKEDTVCVLNGVNEFSLKRTTLEMILNTLHPTTTRLRPHATILTPDHGVNMFINDLAIDDGPLNAYRSMLDTTTETISNIWANYSPCPSCTRKLLKYYKDGGDKPTIHVARIYTKSDDLSHVLESLQCLAKLKRNGFNIVAWNFNDFKAPGGAAKFTEVCNSAIATAYTNANFTSEFMDLESHVTFIQELGDSTHANSWCEA